MVPLDLSRREVVGLPEVSHILNTRIHASIIMGSGSRWRPFTDVLPDDDGKEPISIEITRNIPQEFFRVLIQGFAELFVTFGVNRKAETISFTTLTPVKQLFSLLSGLTEGEVLKYFKRTLRGRKAGSVYPSIKREKHGFCLQIRQRPTCHFLPLWGVEHVVFHSII